MNFINQHPKDLTSLFSSHHYLVLLLNYYCNITYYLPILNCIYFICIYI